MKTKTTILILATILMAGTVSAQSGNYSEPISQLQEAETAIQQMENANIPTERVNSLLTTANRSFRAQKTLAEQGGQPDFSRVEELTNNILEIQETALRVNDRLNALQTRISELEDSNLNLTGVKNSFEEVNNTFNNQRFEEAENQVENVYSEISEAQSVQTQVEAFASAQEQNIRGIYDRSISYTIENWKKISVGAILGILLLSISFREAKLWRMEKKREEFIDKKEVIKNMIEEAQRAYYVEGKGSKMAFETRMNKFQEMKRDTEQKINELETKLNSIRGLPVISPEIKEKTEEFEQKGEVMDETGEVEGSLERISKRREDEEENNPESEKEERSTEESTSENNEEQEKFKEILGKDTVDEAKEDIDDLDNPDYKALLESEREEKNRKSLKLFLKKKLEEEHDLDYSKEEKEQYKEILTQESVKEAKEEIKDLEDPDYKALLKVEKENKDRKTLKQFLRQRIQY